MKKNHVSEANKIYYFLHIIFNIHFDDELHINLCFVQAAWQPEYFYECAIHKRIWKKISN